jgi:glycine/D-amino acid oxidase-like deaminating enzyme
VIVIIGAGVCGLAAAYELARRGERAIVLERGKPFAEQSAGITWPGSPSPRRRGRPQFSIASRESQYGVLSFTPIAGRTAMF